MARLSARTNLARESGQLLRFIIVGAANTAIAFAIYAAGIALGLGYQFASLAALVAGICSGFVAQGKVAFRSQLDSRFVPFVALWALLYLTNILLIGALAFFGIDLYLAGLLAAVPVNAVSFLALRTVIFAPQPIFLQRTALLWLIGLLFVARLYVVTHLALNWDEFLNLSMLYDFRRGEMTEIFQTAFVHLFHWLPMVSTNEVDQLIAARFFTLGCAAFTSLAIFHAARRFMAIDPALVAVIAYNCFGASLLYGTDFRTDTLASAAMIGAIALATHRIMTWPQMVAMGILIAIGGALTIKSVFFLPSIGLLVLVNVWASRDFVRTAKIIAVSAAISVAVLGLILGLHAASLAKTASAASFLGRTGVATLLTGDYSVLSVFWPAAVLGNLGFWVLVLCGAVALARNDQYDAKLGGSDRLALAAFAIPALVPLIYSEVYPYFHPFLIAPISVLAGFGYARLRCVTRTALLVLLLFGAASAVWHRIDNGLAQQRATLALVHSLFPHPVPYIDHTSMVSSFPKKGFFMSRWGVTDYRKSGHPVMAATVRNDQPAFMLQTRALLAVDRITPEDSQRSEYGLFGADLDVLRDNYIRYWGPLFLPGKMLTGSGRTRIEIGGAYRVEGQGRLVANGRSYSDGEIVRLNPGEYAYAADGPLRLFCAAPPPPATPPPASLFSGW
ncbi:GtrA family protein [Sphingobium xenophagum]|uniref:GtrA family protein n=1 Tax=Sphingobium xenophagum TaxID=121428 RepID=UPI0013EE430F|nr:GtrA family protein [Sphingobium xenophagum]